MHAHFSKCTALDNFWFTSYLSRLLSRVVIIPFKVPSIRARNEEQRTAFTSLKANANTSMGSYIGLGKLYRQNGIFDIDDYEERVSILLPNCGGRVLKGYANLLWFTNQVSFE